VKHTDREDRKTHSMELVDVAPTEAQQQLDWLDAVVQVYASSRSAEEGLIDAVKNQLREITKQVMDYLRDNLLGNRGGAARPGVTLKPIYNKKISKSARQMLGIRVPHFPSHAEVDFQQKIKKPR
jgi:hypothetical protein